MDPIFLFEDLVKISRRSDFLKFICSFHEQYQQHLQHTNWMFLTEESIKMTTRSIESRSLSSNTHEEVSKIDMWPPAIFLYKILYFFLFFCGWWGRSTQRSCFFIDFYRWSSTAILIRFQVKCKTRFCNARLTQKTVMAQK